ncbi:MAG TPA: Spy/CpxP family protein refolding chaperone [Gemmatimonadaceae bacterium]|nr:Spy/CpxP family protein refolding chaperone [Gemmatimonadaceae bacterium]
MKKHMLQLAVAMLAGSALSTAAQQPTRPMQMQNEAAMGCMMAMHGMMMGDGMAGGMMRPGEGQMGGMRGEMRGMNDSSSKRGMMNDSAHLAQMRSDLGLSEAQMMQLHTIVQRACTAAQPHMTLAMQAHQAAMQTLQGDNPSLDRFEDQLDKASKHMVAAQVEMAKGMIEVRKSLTPAQRQKLDQMHQQMMRERGMQNGTTPP